MASVQIRDLTKHYDTPGGMITAARDINIDIGDDEFISFVGPSGCGKTTTLRCIAGLETPNEGSIEVEDTDIISLPANERNIAMMFQDIALYPHMTLRKNIAFPLLVNGMRKADRNERVDEVAELMQISELLDKHPGEVSGGQQQRAALARTVVQDPEIFLMDEPLSDLDAKLKREIRKEIKKIHKRLDKPFVYVTHDQEEAMTMSDRIVVMNDGEIVQVGTPSDLYNYPRNVFVGEFIGSPSMNFFDGDLVEKNGSELAVSSFGTELRFTVSEEREELSTSRLILGVRPEEMVPCSEEDGDYDGEVLLIEQTGSEYIVTLESDLGELQMVTTDSSITEGEVQPIRFNDDAIHVFDEQTGNLFAKSTSRQDDVLKTTRESP